MREDLYYRKEINYGKVGNLPSISHGYKFSANNFFHEYVVGIMKECHGIKKYVNIKSFCLTK